MRIGFFTDNYLPSRDGIAISVETFKQQLEAQGHDVYVIAPAPNLTYKEDSDKIIRFPAFKGLFYEDYLTSLFLPLQAMKKIDELNLDIVHYHTLGQVGFLGAYYGMKRNLPLVSTYHTDYYQYVTYYKKTLPGVMALSLITPVVTGGGLTDYRSAILNIKPEKTIDEWNQKIVEKAVTTLHNACDIVIAPSLKIKNQLESWNTTSPIIILPTGVDKIPATKDETNNWRKKLNISTETKVIAYVGRLGNEKNLGLLLNAFEIISRELGNVKLLVIGGSGSQSEDVDSNNSNNFNEHMKNDNIIFTGYVPHAELGALYGLSTVFAFPSQSDTQGLVLNEAAQAGLPIVLIDHEITDVVKDGENGLFSKPDADDMASKIISILESSEQCSKMSKNSINISKEYTAKKQSDKILKIYENLITTYEHKIVL